MISKNIGKKCGWAVSFVILIASIALYHFVTQERCVPVPLSFTSAGTPVVMSMIEGKPYFLQVDLGSKFLLSLDQDVLDSIHNKEPLGITKWRDVKGEFYESLSYRMPSVKIENLVLKDVITKQQNVHFSAKNTLWDDVKDQKIGISQPQGVIGRPLLEKTNLLLDFKNYIMIASNDMKQIKKEGYFLNQMVQVSLEDSSKGIIVKAHTDIGDLRLALDTGATITLIRTSQIQDQKYENDTRGFPRIKSQKFILGNEDFGCTNLFLYDITPELHEIDGVLGMDFLKKHVIYIDYKNKTIFLDKQAL